MKNSWISDKLIHSISKFLYIFDCRLLDIVAKRRNPHGVSGAVLVDGADVTSVKSMSGYVAQVSYRVTQNIEFPSLETFCYSIDGCSFFFWGGGKINFILLVCE